MKKLWYGLLLTAACSGGCWTPFLVPPNQEASAKVEPAPKGGKSTTRSARPLPAIVTADQVSDGNAHEISRALDEELDRAQNREP